MSGDISYTGATGGTTTAARGAYDYMNLRVFSLFGYEKDGGWNSPLWHDPSRFQEELSHRGPEFYERYKEWMRSKRRFSYDEIVDGVWVKLADQGTIRQVQ